MELILEKLMPPILMDLEVSYATRPGQPKTGLVKFDAAVFIAEAILYACGKAASGIDVMSDVSLIIKKMKDEGQLGGHGVDDPPLVIFHPVTGVRLISQDEIEELEKKDLERAEKIRLERERRIAAGEPQPPDVRDEVREEPQEELQISCEDPTQESLSYDYKKYLPQKSGSSAEENR